MPYALEKPFICGVPNAGILVLQKKHQTKNPNLGKELEASKLSRLDRAPPHRMTVANEGLGWDSLQKMSCHLGGDCYWVGLMQLNTAFLCNQCSPFLLSKTHSLRRSTSCGAMWRWHFKPQAHSETPTPSAIDQCPRNERGDLLCP